MDTMPAECPVCGAWALTRDSQMSALLAVCDVLVLKALESMGKWIVRSDRSRFKVMGSRPFREAHMVWQADDDVVSKALKGAWDVVPAMLDTHGWETVTSAQVSEMLDSYVHDLVITGHAHTLEELQYRFATRLNLPIYNHAEV